MKALVFIREKFLATSHGPATNIQPKRTRSLKRIS